MTPTDHEISAGRNCHLNHRPTSICGVTVIEFSHHSYAMPLGHLWYRWTGNTQIEILDVYVTSKARRLGIANRLLLDLRQSWPSLSAITTESANRMSRPWLQRAGFQLFTSGDWMLLLKPIKVVVKGKR